MQTAALPSLPEPRRMASRPVDSMAETMAEGAVVPVTEMRFSFREAWTLVMPARHHSLVGARVRVVGSWCILTVELVEALGDILNAVLAAEGHGERGLEWRYHGWRWSDGEDRVSDCFLGRVDMM